MKIRHAALIGGLPLLLLQACAHQRSQTVTAQMTRTEAVLSQATSAGAEQEALQELQRARSKFAQARRELEEESGSADRKALRLAREAEVDALYALATAQAQRQQQAAAEVQAGVQALEEEARRNATQVHSVPRPGQGG